MSLLGLGVELGLDAELGLVGELGQWGCSLGDARTLAQMPEFGVFRRWLCAYTSECAEGLATIDSISGALDLSNASGKQLDLIGAWISLPRQGIVSDERYRIWLTIQAMLLSGLDVGKGTNIIAITRLFLGPTVDPIVLVNGQYVYELIFPDFDFGAEVPQLIRFLRIATWAAVLGLIYWVLGGVWAYDEISSIPVPDEGLWAYDEIDSIPVPGHLVWSAIFATYP